MVDSTAAVDFEGFANGAYVHRQCRIFPDGTIDTSFVFDIDRRIEEIPRVGAEIVLAEGLSKLSYLGMGPYENYRDRKRACRTAFFETTVEDTHYPYEPPSECGGHEDTTLISFADATGRFVRFESEAAFHFDAHHNTISDYRSARHDHELERRPEIYVHIDAAHAGIGGDMGWSTFLAPEDRVKAGAYLLRFKTVIGQGK